jgi:ABC-2 type transport system permease protein
MKMQINETHLTEDGEWIVSSANRTVRSGFLELIEARPVLYALVKRELKSRYRGSIFGFAWALGRPISMLLVFYFFVGKILGASRSIDYFALYIFISLMFWNLIAESVTSGANSIVQNNGLIQKIAFPREILPIAAVLIASVNTLIQIPVVILGYLIFGVWPTLSQIWLAIPMLLILIILALSLAILLSALNVYIRDVQPLTELSITLLMYASPIIYSWTFVHDELIDSVGSSKLFDIYISNPIAVVITGLQDAFWPGVRKFSDGQVANTLNSITSPTIWTTLGIAILGLLLSYKIFLKLEPNFAREL